MTTQLGAFVLEEAIGAGAMGRVYRARHASEEIHVAIKVDAAPPREETNAAFLREVQLTAALEHPNIVTVLDHGVVDARAAAASGAVLHAGARWLAMELAAGGTAREHVPRSWNEVHHLVRQLLAGLAHAHARGVIHRDIKLENILVAGPEVHVAARPSSLLEGRVLLSDFGVSERYDGTESRSENPIGTPEFMAPELCEGRWRDHGPWTDLYAIGALIWLLTVRDFPFKGQNRWEVYRAHVEQPLPAYRPLMPVPEGLGPLLESLLHKSPAGRPEFAAEVLRRMNTLGPVSGSRLGPLRDAEAATVTLPAPPLRTGRSYAGRSRGPTSLVPRLHGESKATSRIHTAGLGLFGLRTAPFVGRTEVCDRLWTELVAVREEGRARFVSLSGPAGIGKSRLAGWVAERAHELGVAQGIRTRLREGALYGSSLRELLEDELRVGGLAPEELEARLAERFPAPSFDRKALAVLLAPQAYERPPLQPPEARQLALAVLVELSDRRTTVLVVDDLLHDPAALELIRAMLALQEVTPRPILVLGTHREEDLTEHTEGLLEEVLSASGASALRVAPLTEQARRQMVRGLLQLEGSLSRIVEERSAGNPQLVRQVLDVWVERGDLVLSERGYGLAEGIQPTIPVQEVDLWRQRLDNATEGWPDQVLEPLELAAAWGERIDAAAWRGACAMLGMPIVEAVLDHFSRRHLIHLEEGGGWSFSHTLLREVLVERSRLEGHWQAHNLGIAVWMRESQRYFPAADVARHILEAEEWEEAIEPLRQAIHDQVDSGDLRSPRLLDQLREVLLELEVPSNDPDWGELRIMRAARHRHRGELDKAGRLALSVADDAHRAGVRLIEAKALREVAHIFYLQARYDDSLSHALRAQALFLELGDRRRAATSACIAGEVLSATGRLDAAEELFLPAIAWFDEHAPEHLHTPLTGMVLLQHRRGDAERTAEWLQICRAHAEPLGLQKVLAFCANLEGELARTTGHPDEAARCYREAAERFRAIESPAFVFPLLNLGLLDTQAGRFEASLERLRPLVHHNKHNPNPLVETYTHSVLLAARAGVADRDGVIESLGKLEKGVEKTRLADTDVAKMAEQAGELMLTLRWFDVARRALFVAEKQYLAVDHPDDAARARRLRR